MCKPLVLNDLHQFVQYAQFLRPNYNSTRLLASSAKRTSMTCFCLRLFSLAVVPSGCSAGPRGVVSATQNALTTIIASVCKTKLDSPRFSLYESVHPSLSALRASLSSSLNDLLPQPLMFNMTISFTSRSPLLSLRLLFTRYARRTPVKVQRSIYYSFLTFFLLLTSRAFLRYFLFSSSASQPPVITTREYFEPLLVKQGNSLWQSHPSRLLRHETWNSIKYDVVIAVKTGHEVAAKRLKLLKEKGWWSVGRHVPNFLVVSDKDDYSVGAIGLKNYALSVITNSSASSQPSHWFDKSGWRGDKDKNLPAVHLMRSIFPGKKWYVLLDDDTYIFLENFANYVTSPQMNTGAPIYTGKVFYISRCGGFKREGTWAKNHSVPKGVFAHGGSGIVMNAQAIDSMYNHISECITDYSSCWAGDMQLGLCLRRHGVVVRKTKYGRRYTYAKDFLPVSPSKAMADRRYTRLWKSASRPITFHKIHDRELQLLAQFETLSLQNNQTIHFAAVRKYLLENGIVPDYSAQNRKKGRYAKKVATHKS